MLTSVPVALNLSQSTVYVTAVSVISLVFERESQPYCNPYISAFSYVLHWQVGLIQKEQRPYDIKVPLSNFDPIDDNVPVLLPQDSRWFWAWGAAPSQ